MNDSFSRILLRQRHEQMLAEALAARLSQPGRSSINPGDKSHRRFYSFFSKLKSAVVFETPAAVERRSL